MESLRHRPYSMPHRSPQPFSGEQHVRPPQIRPLHARGLAGPHLAGQGHHPGAALVQRGSARRQSGAHRAHVGDAEEAHVRPVGGSGLQGDFYNIK